jgi:hypothetical protein
VAKAPVDDNATKWIEINDFTPGIITNTALQSASPGALGNSGPVPMSKLGQAQQATGCIALPNGGLAPLPSVANTIAPPASSVPESGYVNVITGLFALGPVASGTAGFPGDSVVVGVESIKNDLSERDFHLFDTLWVPHAGLPAYQRTLSPTPLGPATNYGAVPQFCTMTGAPTIASGGGNIRPTFALAYWFLSGTTAPYIGSPYQWLYQNPTADSTSLYLMNVDGSNSAYPAYALAHESRIVYIQKSQFNWTSINYQDVVNEFFNYTEPPLSVTLGTQAETFVPENPTGIQAWGSISSSELFCVKGNGGGFVLTGDLNTPTVTRLPGVQSTYGLCSRVAQTPIGLVYLSNNHGAWLWNGGNTSQKISNQLDDNFYDVPFAYNSQTKFSQAVFDGPAADCCTWGDWIIFSNDWLYDTIGGGWWQMSAGNNGPHVWYQTARNGDILYACPLQPTASILVELYQRSVPAIDFTWTSAPIRLPDTTKDRQLIIKEIIVRAQGTGKVYVNVSGVNQTNPAYMAVNSSISPEICRMTVGANGGGGPMISESMQVFIQSAGATTGPDAGAPAPIVYSVAIGYEETAALVPGTPVT